MIDQPHAHRMTMCTIKPVRPGGRYNQFARTPARYYSCTSRTSAHHYFDNYPYTLLLLHVTTLHAFLQYYPCTYSCPLLFLHSTPTPARTPARTVPAGQWCRGGWIHTAHWQRAQTHHCNDSFSGTLIRVRMIRLRMASPSWITVTRNCLLIASIGAPWSTNISMWLCIEMLNKPTAYAQAPHKGTAGGCNRKENTPRVSVLYIELGGL